MTDRTYSPSGWGGIPATHHSIEDMRQHGESVAVESPDLPIPELARRRATEALAVHFGCSGEALDLAYCACGESFKNAALRQWHVADRALAAALPHLRSLQVETQVAFGRALGRAEATEILEDLIDRNGCHFDHNGGCQEHGWLHESKRCPHARAKDLLGKGDPS